MTLQILEACDRLANLSTSTSSSNNHNHSNKHNNTSSSSNSIRNNSNSSNTSASSFRSPKHHHFFPTTVPTGNPKKDKYAFFTANTGTTETIATSATAATFATNTTTATAATATTTITTSTRGTAGTPSTDGKMAFDTMQQHLKTLLRPLVLRDHEVTLTALWSNTQERRQEEADQQQQSVDDNDSEVSVDEDDLVRVAKTQSLSPSPRLVRPLSYRRGPFDVLTTKATMMTKSRPSHTIASKTTGMAPVAPGPRRTSGHGLASGQELGSGQKPAKGQGLGLSVYHTTTKTPTVSSTGAHASPNRKCSGVGIDVGERVGHHGRDGMAGSGEGLMDSRQRVWEKRVRTLVDRRYEDVRRRYQWLRRLCTWRYQHTPGLGPGLEQEQHQGMDTDGQSL